MKHCRTQPPSPFELQAIEASARRLEQADIEPAKAYAFAVVVRRIRERRFNQAVARDELRRAGWPSTDADAMLFEVSEWRRSVRLSI